MSKKIELTEEQVEKIEVLAEVLTQEQIADYFGIHRSTFNSILKRDERALKHYKKAKSNIIFDIGGGLLAKAREGDLGAMIFFLKTQAQWRETNRVEIESTGDKPTRIILEPAYESKDTDTE